MRGASKRPLPVAAPRRMPGYPAVGNPGGRIRQLERALAAAIASLDDDLSVAGPFLDSAQTLVRRELVARLREVLDGAEQRKAAA